jgi:hypothetical protein
LIPQNGKAVKTLTVRELKPNGEVVDLSDFSKVLFVISPTWCSSDILGQIVGEVDAYGETVEFTFLPEHTTKPGIHSCTLICYNNDDQIEFTRPYFLEIPPNNLFDSTGPLTTAEVRLFIRDVCPENNYLIDEVEFSDTEIAACIRRPIDKFNAMSPPLGYNLNVTNFPFREPWLVGTIGYLMQIAAAWYRRNDLPYSAGGVTVDPKDRAGEYEMLAKERLREFMESVSEIKITLNVAQGFGGVGSQYARMFRI